MNDNYTIQISYPEPYPTCACGCSLTWVFRPDSFHTEGRWQCNACLKMLGGIPHPAVNKIPVSVDQIDKGSLSFRTIFDGPVLPPPRKRRSYKKTQRCCRCGEAYALPPTGKKRGLSYKESKVFCTWRCCKLAKDDETKYKRKAAFLKELMAIPDSIQCGHVGGKRPRGPMFDPSFWNERKWTGELNDFP